MKPIHRLRPLLPAVLAVLLLALVGGVAAAVPAQAAAYRFWGYFQLTDGAWAFAQTGPDQSVPRDGSVEGWRYAVADEASTRAPRATPTFESLCAGVGVTEGSKRVALVIDYGRPADSGDGAHPPAPRATCVSVPVKASGSDVLVAADATLRVSKGLTCAIDGWPATGCGGQVDPVPAAAASPDSSITLATPTPSGSATGGPTRNADSAGSTGGSSRLLTGAGALAVVALVAALGLAGWRRRRDVDEG